MPIVVLDPTTDSEVTERHLAPRVPSLAGRRVGLLDNRKANADTLFDLVESILRERHGVGAFVRRQKPDFSRPAPPGMLDDLRECDAVITGVGDWGSCSSCSVHDAISVEQLGVPAACVVTDGFIPTARMMADLLGLPNYACVVVAHPISHNTETELRAKAEQIVAESLAILRDGVSGGTSSDNGLTTLREMLQADKSDLQLLGIEGGTARLKLILDDPACADCVMPKSYLEPMILQHLRRSHPEVQRVVLDDPR